VLPHVIGARHKLVPIFEDSPGDERGIFKITDAKGEVDTFGNMIDDAVGDEDLNADIGISLLKGPYERGQQRVRDAGGRREPQRTGDVRYEIGSCVVDGITELHHAAGVFDDFRSGVGEAEAPRGAFEQTHAQLIFKLGDAAAYGRGRHFENAGRAREAVGLDYMCEDNERIQIGHDFPTDGILECHLTGSWIFRAPFSAVRSGAGFINNAHGSSIDLGNLLVERELEGLTFGDHAPVEDGVGKIIWLEAVSRDAMP